MIVSSRTGSNVPVAMRDGDVWEILSSGRSVPSGLSEAQNGVRAEGWVLCGEVDEGDGRRISHRCIGPPGVSGLCRASHEGRALGLGVLLGGSVLGVTGALEPVPTLIALVWGAVVVLAAPWLTVGLTPCGAVRASA